MPLAALLLLAVGAAGHQEPQEAPVEARVEAFENAQASFAARRPRRLLPPLASRMDLDLKDRRILAVRTDPRSGRTRGLTRSGLLGHAGDLWIVEKVANRWVRPVFTGVTLSQKGDPPTLFGPRAAIRVVRGMGQTSS